eukprot:763953-Hanusia_phi.AAC.3
MQCCESALMTLENRDSRDSAKERSVERDARHDIERKRRERERKRSSDEKEKSSDSKSTRDESKAEEADSRGKERGKPQIYDASGKPYGGEQDSHRSKHAEKRARKAERAEEEKPAIIDLRERLSQRESEAARGDGRRSKGSDSQAESGKEEDTSGAKRRKKDEGDGVHIPVSQRLGPLKQR